MKAIFENFLLDFLKSIKNILLMVIVLSILGTFLGFFSQYNFIADIFSHFRVQYLLIGFSLIVYYFFQSTKNLKYLVIGITLFVVNIVSVLQYININISNHKADIKICEINLLTMNKHYEKVRKELAKNSPDIIIVEEIDDKWSNELYEIKKDYSFTYEISRNYDNFGIAVYSKIPVKQVKKVIAGKLDTPVISALCDLNGFTFELLAVHTTPPACQEYYENTRQMLENIAAYIESTATPTIVAGDINSSFFSYNYNNFIKVAGLKDSGGVFNPTWSAFHPLPMRISLDHIFVTKHFGIKSFKTGKSTGSDHFPVYAEIYLSK